MFGVLQNFEQAAGQFSPIILIGLGVIILLAGLFIWLGGLGLTKILAGAVGAVAGAVCGLFVIRRTIAAGAFMATFLAAVAVIFERIFFIIFTAALAAMVSFTVFAWPYLGIPKQLPPINQSEVSIHGPALSVGQTVEVVKVYLVNFNYELEQVRSWMPLQNWVIIAALAAVFLFTGFSRWRLTSALNCAALGTMLIFAGMVLLLLYKGSAPISGICRKVPFYGCIFIAMTVAGTVEQLLLFRREEKHSTKRKKATDDKERPGGAKQSWRTI